MSRTIKIWRDPYGEGFSTCPKAEIEIFPGTTVLVGCNGAGKTTLLRNIREELQKNNIPVYFFDNKKDGGANSVKESMFEGNTELAAAMITSSEGENILLNLQRLAKKFHGFIQNGHVHIRKSCFFDPVSPEEMIKAASNERWILLDAMDSGYSIDNVIEMKEFFDFVAEEGRKAGMDVYIVVSSNEYELAHGSECFDVMDEKYVRFESYEEYKTFILKTREKKEKRYKK